MSKKFLRIGGASGYWGDAPGATAQLLQQKNLDFLVYDYLAEITMSILARARAKDPRAGFAQDFVSAAMGPNLGEIARQNVRVITNAGGVNPLSCAASLREEIDRQGLSLKVACIHGDDLVTQAENFSERQLREMFTGKDFPSPDKIASINAYTGAFAISRALDLGADIVITGRCVDSAVTLGACIHTFGWQAHDYDLLACGSLAGHILECGAQASGGNFTDWELCASSMGEIGYPVVEMQKNGQFDVTKGKNTGGLISVGTIGEQIVYEIGDPQSYHLPDVTCDFSNVALVQTGNNTVTVKGAIGRPPPETLKIAATWYDGYRGGHLLTFYGFDAEQKATRFAEAVIERSSTILASYKLGNFSQTSIEVLGAESQFGAQAEIEGAREVCVKIAVRHASAKGVGVFLREITGLALSGPPGLSGFAGTRPKPMPVVALFCFTLPREEVSLSITLGDINETFQPPLLNPDFEDFARHAPPKPPAVEGKMVSVPLIMLAIGRSGDKGNKANIGIIARKKEYMPYIWQQLTCPKVAKWFDHFLKGDVERYYLPGLNAINFVLNDVLEGGGTSSLRNDPQAKGYAQLLLAAEIEIPVEMAARLL